MAQLDERACTCTQDHAEDKGSLASWPPWALRPKRSKRARPMGDLPGDPVESCRKICENATSLGGPGEAQGGPNISATSGFERM